MEKEVKVFIQAMLKDKGGPFLFILFEGYETFIFLSKMKWLTL